LARIGPGDPRHDEARVLLARIGAMLTGMVKAVEDRRR
jgi:hypothetical protein